jgi:hypothetical protein
MPDGQDQNVSENQDTQGEILTREDHIRELKRVGKKEKAEGQQKAINDLLQQTGAESIDDLVGAWTEYQDIQDAVSTEAEQANRKAERIAAERDSYKERATRLEDKVKRASFIENVSLPNARAAWAVARDEGLEVEWDDDLRPTNLPKIAKELQKIDPQLFGSGSADAGTDPGRITENGGGGMNALIRGAAGR